MPTTWIIAANAGRARIFEESDAAKPLVELEDMVNNAARLRTQESETDTISPTAAAGSGHAIGGGQGGGSQHNGKAGAPNKQYQPATTPAEHEAELFAKDLSKYLVSAQQEGRFQHLILSASPQFLGVLRNCLDAHIKPLIKHELNKDYTHVAAHQLREQIEAHQAKSEAE